MRELKLLTHTFNTPKTHVDGYYTLKTSRASLPVQTSLDFHNTFCSGLCTEATCFDDLCGACITEYHEYKGVRSEM